MPDTPEINLARANALNVSNVSTSTDSLFVYKFTSWCYDIPRELFIARGEKIDWVGMGKTP